MVDSQPSLRSITRSSLEIVSLRRGPLVEPGKRKARWGEVGADTYSVLAYSCSSDRPKRQGSAMQAPSHDDHFLNHRDQCECISRNAEIVRHARGWNRLSPNRVAALIH
jgi:hypothetical protein